MFDLFRRRDKAVRYLLGGLLGLVAISLVVTLIPGYGTPTGTSEQVLAEIDGEPVTVRQVQLRLQNVMRNQNLPREMVSFYVPQMVDQIINEEALAFQARRMGFEVSDEEVAQAIRGVLGPLFPAGDFNPDMYQRFLAQQGTSVREFEDGIRRSILVARLHNLPVEGVIVTPDEVNREYKRRNDRVKLEYIAYSPGDLKSQVTVTPEEVKAHYEGNKPKYQTPETRSLEILISDEEKLAAAMQVPESELRKMYNDNMDRYRNPERVKISHILIGTQGKPPAEAAAAEKKAADLLKQIKGGADFAALAKEHSGDPGSKALGGDVGWVSRNGQMVKPFEDAALKLAKNEVSGLVKTDFGWHILKATDRENARLKPFEEVKAELAVESRKLAVREKLQDLIEQARAKLQANPKQAQQIASELGLQYVKADRVAAGAAIPGVPNSTAIDTSSLKPGEVSQVVQLDGSRLAVAVLNAVAPPRQAELAEVESQIRNELIESKVTRLRTQKMSEAEAKMRAAKTDLAAAAKSLGLEVKTTQPFGTEGAADGIGPATYMMEAFTSPVGATVGPFTIGEQIFLARVVEKQETDPSKMSAAEREGVITAIKRRKSSERRELFEDGLVTALIKEGKVKKFPDSIKRLVSTFQG